ncbi:MAG: NAD-dependent epimerase/dehydratase family protein [Planctomycetota bacterium]
MTSSLLVTGGAGFLGSHLAERLLAEGVRVLALDDLSTGVRANVAALEERPDFELTVASAMDAEVVERLVGQVDGVVHLAAAVGVKRIVDRPVSTIVTNVEATRVVLEAAAERGVPVLLASTSEVYGKSDAVPFREDADVSLGATTRSRWSYACSKALDEWLALAYRRERGVPVRICRFFNVVGPRQVGRYGMVLPSFARQALRGEPLTVYGDGRQSRCFAHVHDVVDAVVRLLRCPAAEGEVVNVGSDVETTILALAERVRDAAGSSAEIMLVPYEEAYAEGFEDMRRRVPDLSKLRELVGFEPRTSLDEIVADVLASQREALAAGR